ncbi:MAG: hypothetical protein RIQ52_1926 [Pseudomonadota bacterium]
MKNTAILLLALLLAAGQPVVSAQATVDINHADADAIAEALRGVGKAKAVAIVHDREVNGPFTSIDDLKRIKGIKDAVVEHNRDIMTLGQPASSQPVVQKK